MLGLYEVTLFCVKDERHMTLTCIKLPNQRAGINPDKPILVIHFGRDFPGQAIL